MGVAAPNGRHCAERLALAERITELPRIRFVAPRGHHLHVEHRRDVRVRFVCNMLTMCGIFELRRMRKRLRGAGAAEGVRRREGGEGVRDLHDGL